MGKSKWGNPHEQNDKGLDGRFWEKVDKSGDCWLWMGGKHKSGHGYFRYKNRSHYAHRISWMIEHGELPRGKCVLHHCDVASCVNPAHLYVGTRVDNMRDMNERGRHHSPIGELAPTAKLTENSVREIRKLKQQGMSAIALGKRYGVTSRQIHSVVSRESWSHIP